MTKPEVPLHHRADGGFQNPWPDATHPGSLRALVKWQLQRLRNASGSRTRATAHRVPCTHHRAAWPHASPEEIRITWLGQSGFLLQLAARNILLDPVLSVRASPLSFAGPTRVVHAAFTPHDLPPIDAVILSHDHYDHLDAATLAAVAKRFPYVRVFTPVGYHALMSKLGMKHVTELDWWNDARLEDIELTCLPAQHWTRRAFASGHRLWSSWYLKAPQKTIYFAGDSGYCPVFREIHDRLGSPDIALLPIGAYEPRWFMKAAHMNPEEAVDTFKDLGAKEFVAMHWGTFRLTDEPLLEPPERTRAAWRRHGLPPEKLHIPAHGETLIWR